MAAGVSVAAVVGDGRGVRVAARVPVAVGDSDDVVAVGVSRF